MRQVLCFGAPHNFIGGKDVDEDWFLERRTSRRPQEGRMSGRHLRPIASRAAWAGPSWDKSVSQSVRQGRRDEKDAGKTPKATQASVRVDGGAKQGEWSPRKRGIHPSLSANTCTGPGIPQVRTARISQGRLHSVKLPAPLCMAAEAISSCQPDTIHLQHVRSRSLRSRMGKNVHRIPTPPSGGGFAFGGQARAEECRRMDKLRADDTSSYHMAFAGKLLGDQTRRDETRPDETRRDQTRRGMAKMGDGGAEQGRAGRKGQDTSRVRRRIHGSLQPQMDGPMTNSPVHRQFRHQPHPDATLCSQPSWTFALARWCQSTCNAAGLASSIRVGDPSAVGGGFRRLSIHDARQHAPPRQRNKCIRLRFAHIFGDEAGRRRQGDRATRFCFSHDARGNIRRGDYGLSVWPGRASSSKVHHGNGTASVDASSRVDS
ncbi:hypothetical protein RJ55_07261 [Drechmeria coniospora]|nr:hypothetical protein RJ55_07261 [Drechmeria coniospora]